MVLDIDESDQDKILELLTISRVNDFTLSNFMINLWFNSIGALVMFSLFFCCCRLYRNDKERFIQKLHKMQPTSAVDSDDDEYDQGLKLMHLDASLMTSRVNADEQMDVLTGGRMDGWTGGRAESGQTDERTSQQTEVCTDGQMDV